MLVLLLAISCRKLDDEKVFAPASQTETYWTLDLDLQELAVKHIVKPLRAKIESGQLPPDTDCAFVLLDAVTGDVLVYVATIQPDVESDIAQNLTRSCGSVAKLVVYAAALQARAIEPDAQLLDAPRSFPCLECRGGVWQPDNYGNQYSNGLVSLIEAFAWSKNVPAVDVYQRLQRKDFVTVLDGLGLPLPKNFTTAPLGVEWTPMQLASAHSAFVNHGVPVKPRFLSHQIINGQRQETPIVKRPQVFREDVCQWIIAAGRLCLSEGTGRHAADLSDVLAGKTGSSDSALVAMFGPRVSAVVWIGNRLTNKDLGTTGGRLALPHLAEFFRAVRRVRPALLPKWN
jgi:membrane peptidoglycan carboxypeptidase